MSKDFVITQCLQTIDQIVSDQQQSLANAISDLVSDISTSTGSANTNDFILKCLATIDKIVVDQKQSLINAIGFALDSYAIEQNELNGTITEEELETIIENETRPLFNKIDEIKTELSNLLLTLGH